MKKEHGSKLESGGQRFEVRLTNDSISLEHSSRWFRRREFAHDWVLLLPFAEGDVKP